VVHLHGRTLGRRWDVVLGCGWSGWVIRGLEKPGLSCLDPRQLAALGRHQRRASGMRWGGEWWTLWGGRGRWEGREVHQEMQKTRAEQRGEDLGRALPVTGRGWEGCSCWQWMLGEKEVG